jgi:hypothetical protein
LPVENSVESMRASKSSNQSRSLFFNSAGAILRTSGPLLPEVRFLKFVPVLGTFAALQGSSLRPQDVLRDCYGKPKAQSYRIRGLYLAERAA